MASVGIRKRISSRTGRVSYQVWWLLDDGSQGAKTVATKDEARALATQKRLEVTRGTPEGAARGGNRSAGGPTSGGRCGQPTPTAAPPRWRQPRTGCGATCSPLVDDPARLDGVAALGLDETGFLRATPTTPTRYVTGLVDVAGGRLLDVIADRTSRAVAAWLGPRPRCWLAGVVTVALDPWRGYASALAVPLGHGTMVVDHFHAIKLANTAVDQT